jgi:hypothetical protein
MSEILRMIDGRCVTIEEIEEVAAWCNGDIGIMYEKDWLDGEHYIHVGSERAVVGDWIVTDGANFQCVTDAEYKKTFEAAMRNRKKFVQILELVSDAIHQGAPSVIHGVGIDKNIVAEQAALQIMQIL